MEIVKGFVMPVAQRGGGARGSKFYSVELAEILLAMEVGDAIFIDGMDAADCPSIKRQRYATAWRIEQEMKKLDNGRKFTVGIVVGKDGEADKLAVQLTKIVVPKVADIVPLKADIKDEGAGGDALAEEKAELVAEKEVK